jgi:hypothetical protein
MVSASLSSLPPELLCLIFQSADNFSVVAALARTARIFNNTWRQNPTCIYKAVASRIVSNLADAERLVAVQEEAEASRQDGCDDRAILRAKRLLFNARCASTAYDKWERSTKTSNGWNTKTDWFIKPSERARFEHAFYCVRTIGVMARTTHLHEQASAFLDRLSPIELCTFEQFSTWVKQEILSTWVNGGYYGSFGLDFCDETWRAGCNQVFKRWTYLSTSAAHPVPSFLFNLDTARCAASVFPSNSVRRS